MCFSLQERAIASETDKGESQQHFALLHLPILDATEPLLGSGGMFYCLLDCLNENHKAGEISNDSRPWLLHHRDCFFCGEIVKKLQGFRN